LNAVGVHCNDRGGALAQVTVVSKKLARPQCIAPGQKKPGDCSPGFRVARGAG